MYIYERIANHYRDLILHDTIKHGEHLPTEETIAKEYSTTRVTVRRALDILKNEGLIRSRPKLGSVVVYSSKPLRRVLVSMPIKSVEFDRFVEGVREYLSAYNIGVDLYHHNNSPSREMTLIQKARSEYSGLITNATYRTLKSNVWAKLSDENFPFVFFDSVAPNCPYDYVLPDGYHGIRETTNLLIREGHKRIAMFNCYAKSSYGMILRKNGFVDAMKEHGLYMDQTCIFSFDSDLPLNISNKQSEKLAERILSRHQDFTAVVCATDVLAAIILTHARENLIEVPRNVSVTGFDDNVIAKMVTPNLTTYAQDFEEMGRRSGEIVADKLLHPDKHIVHQLLVRGTLVERDSTKRRYSRR